MIGEERDTHHSDDFDPRYDPAFQRGYQPRPGERAETRVRTAPPAPAVQRTSAAPPEREEARASEPLWGADDLPPVTDAVPVPTTAVAPAVFGSPGPALRFEVNPRRNPFMLALWLVGAGFVVLGIVLYCVSVATSYSGPTPSSDLGSLVFAQLGWMLAGPLITVGLVTIVGLLFLTAVASSRSSAPAPPGE